MVSDLDVLKVAVFFKKEVRKFGKDFKFPKCKDYTKTYQFRWVKSFVTKCRNDDFTIDETIEIARCLIKYANKNKILHLGAALFGRNDVVDIAYKKFNNESKTCDMIINDLKRCMEIVSGIDDFLGFLIRKPNRKGYPNYVLMYSNGELSKTFMSLSLSCMRAYSMIGEDKEELPSLLELAKTRLSVIDKVGGDNIREVMGGEYNGQ